MEGVASPFKCGVPDPRSPSDAQTTLIARAGLITAWNLRSVRSTVDVWRVDVVEKGGGSNRRRF